MRVRGVGAKLNILTGILVLLTCVAVTSINYRIGRSCLGTFLEAIHMPAVMKNISSVVDDRLIWPAKSLDMVAENPFLIRWVKEGEPEAGRETVYELLKGVIGSLGTGGANVVLWDNQSYYDMRDGKASFKTLSPSDAWFKAFKESGKTLDINLHINDPVYGSMAFINRRIESDGRFLGLTSVSLDLATFNHQITDTTVGEKGETYMVDRTGRVMLHRNRDLIQRQTLADKAGWGEHAEAALSKKRSVIRLTDARGDAIIAMTRFVPELGWYLVAEANEDELIETVSSTLLKEMNGALIAILVVTFLLLAVGVGACLFFSYRTIIRPINETVARIKDIATGEGDLTLRLPEGRKDEIGELASWVNTFMEKLQNIVARISRSAEEVTAASEELLGISRDLVNETRDTSEKASAANAATEQTGSGIEAISETMADTSRQAAGITSAADGMGVAIQAVSKGAGEAMQQTGAAVETADRTLETITRMGRAATQIETVSEAVTEISEQTKLLSLNATIEAARAGEYGKGFAVVADEIRALSLQTAEAIEAIKKTVQGIQDATRESLEEIHAMTEAVKNTHNMVGGMEQAVDAQAASTQDITRHINQIAVGIDTVSERVRAGSLSARETTVDIRNVCESAERMSGSGRQVQGSAEQLSVLARDLRSAISSFRI